MGKVLFGDTDTIVGYFDQDPLVHVIKRELDASVGDTVFDGVVDEVDQREESLIAEERALQVRVQRADEAEREAEVVLQ